MRKKRILLCGEFSRLATGYSTYAYELLTRLYSTDKYEIAEFASYVSFNDPRLGEVPWRVYANAPTGENQEEINVYNSNQSYQFGSWRFHDVVLDFKPDIVISILDPWMFEHISRSPLRPYFQLLLMPTVDSAPQQESWLDMFMDADAVFTYNDWSRDVLKQEAGDLINVIGSASPCASAENYFPIIDKAAHKKALGIDPNSLIIGTVMRNQKRKLYPDLMDGFNLFLEKCGNGSFLQKNTYLYFHTSYPDLGWDIPSLIKDKGLSHKVLLTYICHNCRHVFPSFFQDSRTGCPSCGQFQAGLPNTQTSVSTQTMGAIMNLFDVYVQYSITEGFGMPMVEAASCGVPVLAVDHSAMSDVVRKLKGYPIKVERLFLEPETAAYRCYPDNSHLAEVLHKFCNLSQRERSRKGMDAHKAVKQHYVWDQTAKKWENQIDQLPTEERWDQPPRLFQPNTNVPPNLSNEQFTQWAIHNVLGEPDKINGYFALRMVRDLNYGAFVPGYGGTYISDQSYLSMKPNWMRFNREDAMSKLLEMRQYTNYLEQRRVGMVQEPQKDYIVYAKPDSKVTSVKTN